MTKMSAQAVTFLTNSVRSRGMMKYLQRDVIGRDICNVNFSSGIQGFEQWKEEFRNHENDELVIRLHIWNALKAQYHFLISCQFIIENEHLRYANNRTVIYLISYIHIVLSLFPKFHLHSSFLR